MTKGVSSFSSSKVFLRLVLVLDTTSSPSPEIDLRKRLYFDSQMIHPILFLYSYIYNGRDQSFKLTDLASTLEDFYPYSHLIIHRFLGY